MNWNSNMPEKSFVISVLNMKGGVGKTTLSANVFREVFQGHKLSTLLIDFDPQFNLTQMLLSRKKYESLQEEGRTLFRVMEQPPPTSVLQVSKKDLLVPPLTSEISHTLKTLVNSGERFDLIAGDFNLVRFNLRENDGLEIPRKRLEKFIKKAKEEYKIIVLDCNPSSSFLTRIAIENATHLLIPVRPDRYSVLGLDLITGFMDILPNLIKQPELLIIMNDVPYGSPPGEVETQIRSHKIYGPACLAARIPSSKILQMKTYHIGFGLRPFEWTVS
jgi:chromosome partitioning protein